jgi:hypothetical protein
MVKDAQGNELKIGDKVEVSDKTGYDLLANTGIVTDTNVKHRRGIIEVKILCPYGIDSLSFKGNELILINTIQTDIDKLKEEIKEKQRKLSRLYLQKKKDDKIENKTYNTVFEFDNEGCISLGFETMRLSAPNLDGEEIDEFLEQFSEGDKLKITLEYEDNQ